jgi:hypothetical protein
MHLATLTAWNGAPLVNLTVAKLVKKFFAIYGIRGFITVFTRAYLPSTPVLSQINPVHKGIPYSLRLNFSIILSSTPGSSD